jgi:hypothetical protein
MEKTPDVLERVHELVARVVELCSKDAIRSASIVLTAASIESTINCWSRVSIPTRLCVGVLRSPSNRRLGSRRRFACNTQPSEPNILWETF